jgi:hypothetical protein
MSAIQTRFLASLEKSPSSRIGAAGSGLRTEAVRRKRRFAQPPRPSQRMGYPLAPADFWHTSEMALTSRGMVRRAAEHHAR